ncbi:hypothetical protein AVEN_12228-1 [Araneus ventricosus]|uniref:Uncharacterized protein n=1 Tax=Araneus ventricosus TaxID=182803 RepID=A0A4Y2UQ62_ARAVE|nr:hypothetical protein AVEN_12228-1 [Araneus ventricosus]
MAPHLFRASSCLFPIFLPPRWVVPSGHCGSKGRCVDGLAMPELIMNRECGEHEQVRPACRWLDEPTRSQLRKIASLLLPDPTKDRKHVTETRFVSPETVSFRSCCCVLE